MKLTGQQRMKISKDTLIEMRDGWIKELQRKDLSESDYEELTADIKSLNDCVGFMNDYIVDDMEVKL